MSSNHFIKKCRHGTLVMQCRCPNKDKQVITVACPPHCATKRPPDPDPSVFTDVTPMPPSPTDYEWPLVGERLKHWGQDA